MAAIEKLDSSNDCNPRAGCRAEFSNRFRRNWGKLKKYKQPSSTEASSESDSVPGEARVERTFLSAAVDWACVKTGGPEAKFVSVLIS